MDLLNFYRDWLDWAEDDGTPGIFNGKVGLCMNLHLWCARRPGTRNLKFELENEFEAAERNVSYPFGKASYERLRVSGLLHTQPARLRWVRKRIKEIEKQSQPQKGT